MVSKWICTLVVGTGLSLAYACGGDSDKGKSGEEGTGGSGGSGGDGGAAGSPSSGGTASTKTGGTAGSGGSDASGGTGMGGSAGDGGGEPVQCADDADCESIDMVCEPLQEQCVECLFDSDCGDEQVCRLRRCENIVECVNSLDCVDANGLEVCDGGLGRCVECVTSSDCLGTADCVNNMCRPYVPCQNSLDCPQRQVCSANRCVQCGSDADCSEGARCVANTCWRGCSSDNDCTPLGQLCNTSGGHCARCLVHEDCPAAYHCSSGRCLADVCEGGSGYCSGNTLRICRAAGDGYDTVACATNQTCVGGDEAACEDWICTAGQVECDATASSVITCADDGLSIVSSMDCTESDEICYQGSCEDLVCPPSTLFCDANTVQLCSADGLSSSLYQTCLSTQYCNASTSSCQNQICVPDQPACNGRIATTCNSTGSGYVAGGTDCEDTDEACVAGECAECNSNVLLLGDSDTTGNAAMQAGLEMAGMTVTLVTSGVLSYDGTPAASDFGVVVASTGNSYSGDMPSAGQTSIVTAHAAGTGFVTNEWASYQVELGYNTTLAPLYLLEWVTSTSASSFTLTSAGHPIWEGLDTTITTTTVSVATGTLVNGGVSIATCNTCTSGNAVAVRDTTGGRLVHFAHAGNATSAYLDANLLKMFVNAVQWAAACK